MRYTLLLLATLSFSVANAEPVKVLQVKGRKAVISFPETMTLEKGQTLQLGEGDDDSSGSSGGGNGSRVHNIDLTFSYDSETTETEAASEDQTEIELTAEYGWNTGMMEYGPTFSYTSTETDTSDSTQMAIGGFFDYNFTENKPGNMMIPYVGGKLTYVSYDADNSDASGFGIGLEGGMKWFPWNDQVAIPVFAKYSRVALSSDGSDITLSAFGLGAGIAAYF